MTRRRAQGGGDQIESERKKAQYRGGNDPMRTCRNEVWLAFVRSRSRRSESYAALGRRLLSQTPDADNVSDSERVLARIAHAGSDPGRSRDSLGKRSVVDLIAEHPLYAGSKAVYEHVIWEILGPKPLTIDEQKQRQHDLIRGLFWTDAGRAIAPTADVLEVVNPDRLPIPRAAYRRIVFAIARRPALDALALLSLMYMRALRTDAPDEARLLHGAVLRSARRFALHARVPPRTAALFIFLVRRRVLAGRAGLDHAFEVDLYAGDLLHPWHAFAETDEEAAWVCGEQWRLACALENTMPLGLYAGCDDAIPADVLDCEHQFLTALRDHPTARQIGARIAAATGLQ